MSATSPVLLDPSIVFEAVDEVGLNRLQDWTMDRRVRLGARTWFQLVDVYSAGTTNIPKYLARIARRTFGDLLARPPLEHSEAGVQAELSVAYRGEARHRDILVDDLVGVGASSPGSVLGTVDILWNDPFTTIACVPPPPNDFPVHFEPNLPSYQDLRDRRAAWFSGRRVLIVGGQVDAGVIRALSEHLSLATDDVRWLPSEKGKRARNLKNVIQGLPSTSVVVCIVGKVGHDVSGEVKDYTGRQALVLCESRFASQILDDLTALADRDHGSR